MDNSLNIVVPQTDWNGGGTDMRSRLQTWRWLMPGTNHDGVRIDFQRVKFIEPWALAMFVSHARRLKIETGRPIEVVLDSTNACNAYIEQMGLITCIAAGQTDDRWSESTQNTGLHLIRRHSDVGAFSQSAQRVGAGVGSETLDALIYAVLEIARNVVQHAHSPGGGVAIVQRFPERKTIQIAIADAGIGVLESLRPNYPELRNHLEALKLAVLPHVSGASPSGMYGGSDNAGLGLFFCKEIAWRAGGRFWLVSHAALLGIHDEDASARNRIYRRIEDWRGTVVVIDLPEGGLDDFGAALHECQTLAANARALSGPTGIDYLTEVPELDNLVVIRIADFLEDVDRAALIRDQQIIPAVHRGDVVALDFSSVRFVTQSFAHALLHEPLKIPGALVRMSMIRCSKSTREAIQAVAAYSASYRQIDF